MTRAGVRGSTVIIGFVLCAPGLVHAQGAALDVSAGRIVYEPVSSRVSGHQLTGTLRFEEGDGRWMSATVGVPLGREDLLWGGGGAGGRVRLFEGARTSVGLDLGIQGYLFRDGVVDETGAGAMLDAMPVVTLETGAARVELRGGWRGHAQAYRDGRDARGVLEAGARVVHGVTLRLAAEGKWVRSSEGGFPFAGATLAYGGRSLQGWLEAGKWLSESLHDWSWGAGLGVVLNERATLWTRAWQEAPDPLYWNVARRSWSAGVTTRLGRWPSVPRPVTVADGAVHLAVPAAEAPGRALFIAGDFNGWRRMPLQREGAAWVVRLRLEPGVYRYAFTTDEGRWFVPVGTPGRRDDGFGGHVALLVVG